MKGKEKRAESTIFWTEERELPEQVLELGMRPLKWRKNLSLSGQINGNALGVFKPMLRVADNTEYIKSCNGHFLAYIPS
jgi:hypothetical protein